MKKGVLLALFTAVISGVSIFINKFGVAGVNPFMFSFMKNLVVGLFLFSVIVLFKNFKEIKRLKYGQWGQLLLIGVVGGCVPFLLFFYGLKITSAMNAAFIHKTLFIWVSVLAVIFLKEKINKKYLIGAFLLIVANLILIKSFSFGFGEFLIFIATVLWSVEIAISKHVLKKLSSEVVAFGRMFFGSIFILIFLLVTGNFTFVSLPQLAWVGLTSVFLFFYVFTFYGALKLEKATVVTPILLLGSFITLVLNYSYNGVIVPIQIVSSLLVLSGLFMIIRFSSYSLQKA